MFDLWWFFVFFIRFVCDSLGPSVDVHTFTLGRGQVGSELSHFDSFWDGAGLNPTIFGGDKHQQIPAILGEFRGFSPIAIWEWISSMWKNMTCHVLVKVSAISLPREVAPVKRFRRSAWWHKPQRKSTTLWTGFDVDVRIGWRLGLWYKKHYIIYAHVSSCGVIGKYHGFLECVSLKNQLSEWSDMMKNVWP